MKCVLNWERLLLLAVVRNTKWIILNDALKWLDTEDDLYLAALINANLKFFSEILHILSQEKWQVQKIYKTAVNEYGILWKTK